MLFKSKALCQYEKLRKLGFRTEDIKEKDAIFNEINTLISSNLGDEKLMTQICIDNPINFNKLPKNYRGKKSFVLNVLDGLYPHEKIEFAHIEPKLQKDEEVAIAYLQHGGKPSDFCKELKNNYKVMLCALEHSPTAINYISDELSKNILFAHHALNIDYDFFKVLSKNLGNHYQTIKLAVSLKAENLKYVSDMYKDNEHVIYYAITDKNGLLKENVHDIIALASNRIQTEFKNVDLPTYINHLKQFCEIDDKNTISNVVNMIKVKFKQSKKVSP